MTVHVSISVYCFVVFIGALYFLNTQGQNNSKELCMEVRPFSDDEGSVLQRPEVEALRKYVSQWISDVVGLSLVGVIRSVTYYGFQLM